MNDISNATNAKSAGSIPRLRPYEIATLLIAPGGGRVVRVMDATDDEFQMFVLDAGLPVEEDGITEWSFDDRCGIINHALKHGIVLPFADPNKNNSEQEQKTIRSEQREMAPQQGMVDIPNAPIISGWATIIKETIKGQETREIEMIEAEPDMYPPYSGKRE